MEQPKSFEESMKRLEEIVAELEKGDLSLDVSLQRYEEGIRALRHCESILKKAEEKIQILLQDEEGNLKEQPFEMSPSGDGEASAGSARPGKKAGGRSKRPKEQKEETEEKRGDEEEGGIDPGEEDDVPF